MKAYIFLLLLTCTTYISQAQSTIDSATFHKSYAVWKEKKKSSNNSYKMVLQQSSFTGWVGETTITVKEGIIVKRSYREKSMRVSKRWKAKRWTEKGGKIGKHQEEGVKPITLDEIYAYAQNYLPRPEAQNQENTKSKEESEVSLIELNFTVFFNLNQEGMISLIGSRHNECMDDCFRGYRITEIKWLD
jgi:major membrane immunogen (membrane-anchored lipoprotein)